MKKIYILLILLMLKKNGMCSEFDLVQNGGINGLTKAVVLQVDAQKKQTDAIKKVADEIGQARKTIPLVMDEIEKASNDRDKMKNYSYATRGRLEGLEDVVKDQKTWISKLQLMMESIIDGKKNQGNWIKGTFFVVLGATLTAIFSAIGGIIFFIINFITKRSNQPNS